MKLLTHDPRDVCDCPAEAIPQQELDDPDEPTDTEMDTCDDNKVCLFPWWMFHVNRKTTGFKCYLHSCYYVAMSFKFWLSSMYFSTCMLYVSTKLFIDACKCGEPVTFVTPRMSHYINFG